MKKCYNFLLLILLSVLFTSCDTNNVKYTPHMSSQYSAVGAKSIIYKEYGENSKLNWTEEIEFDEYGREVVCNTIPAWAKDTTISKKVTYGSDGEILEVKYISYGKPMHYWCKYDDFGFIIEERYSEEEPSVYYRGKHSVTNYSYDNDGNVIKKEYYTDKYDENINYTVNHLYHENRLCQTEISDNEGIVIYYYDTIKGIVTSEVLEDWSGNEIEKSAFSYKYDERGNWIEQVRWENDKVVSTTKREIVYYPEEELVDIDAYVYEEFVGVKFIDDYINDVLSRHVVKKRVYSPNAMLFIILLTCTVIVSIIVLWKFSKSIFHNFWGKVQANGMKRLWMYNIQPYEKVGTIILICLGAFVLSVILLFAFGGFVWVFLWIIRILLFIIVAVGVICAVVGGISILFGAFEIGCLPLIIGIPLCIYAEDIQDAGEDLVDWGFEFMKDLNLFNWGINLFVGYWDTILVVFCTPMLVFLSIALLVILLNLMLNGLEFIITRIYSVRRPCPVCGSTDTPEYIIGGIPHPVKLHPGMYGIFSHTSPVTGQRVPTMLLNGRGKVTRKCKKCNSQINAETENTFGTEIHIGIVGHRSSGKSYLLYSGLSSLMAAYPNQLSQTDMVEDTNIEDNIKRIQANDGIQTDVANRYRAIQLMLKSKLRPVPYHLFFYDVAGEKFNISSSSHKTAMDFYRNVQTIVFVIDPSMIDISGIHVSPSFANWYDKNVSGETHKIESTFSVLKSILETVGRKSDKIDFNFVFTKSDMGYLTELGYTKNPSEEELERFMSTELGLSNLINSSRASFKNVHFYAVSAVNSDKSNLRLLFETLLTQRKVSF